MYVCAAPFLRSVPQTGRRSKSPAPESRVIEMIESLPATDGSAIYIDLPPTHTLRLTPQLNDLGFRVVPIIQRWVAAPAVIPCGELSRQLVEAGAAARSID